MQNKKTKTVRARRTHSESMAASVGRIYQKSGAILLGEAFLFAAVAMIMAFRPISVLAVLTVVIGIALIIFGLYRTISGFVVSRNFGGGGLDVVFGIINVILGILFCVYPVGSIISITYIFVVLFLFKALRALVFAINMVRARFGHYWFDLIMAIILCAAAVALLVWPTVAPIAMIYYLAIMLLVYAASDVYMFIELWRLRRQIAD